MDRIPVSSGPHFFSLEMNYKCFPVGVVGSQPTKSNAQTDTMQTVRKVYEIHGYNFRGGDDYDENEKEILSAVGPVSGMYPFQCMRDTNDPNGAKPGRRK